MPLIRTFEALAAGDEDLLTLLDELTGIFTKETEASICDGVVALVCENPQCPAIGQKLYLKLLEKFPGDKEPNFLNLATALQNKLGFLRELVAKTADHQTEVAEPVRVLTG